MLNIIDYSNVHFLIYFSNVFIVNTYYHLDKIKNTEVQKAKLKQQLSDVKVNILKYQLHPHFFFNTLNSISQLIEVDKTLAQNTLADFSDLLRDIVYLKDTNFLNLGKELDILNRYLDIMSIRFSDHLEIKLNVQDDIEDILIPSLIIQPIIENSFNHGYSDKNTSLKIEISIKQIKDNLEIKIKNNGAPLAQKNVIYGTGLKNTIERLETLYEDGYKFSIKNLPNENGVVTNLVFPVRYN
ncbi:sensor histidine kinase [Mariniflexile sp. HMF6888]|uniref:sensor histidine kinase n=1 Tax=Mariniflexile sp. HMF6888 TaxID=3373086 RepID=UPI0037BA5E31